MDEPDGRRWPWIVGGGLALLVIGAFSWMTVAQSMASVDADDLGFTLVDEHSVEVSFQVTGVQGRDVVCALEALDEEFGVVGWKSSRSPPGTVTHRRSRSPSRRSPRPRQVW